MKVPIKPYISSLFPNASKSTVAANSHLMAPNGGSGKPNASTGIVGAGKGKRKHNETTNLGKIPNPEPQPDKTTALGAAVQGKAKGLSRVTVRFVGYRVRPLDPDNFAGSIKDLLDGLRHSGLISGDEPWRIKLETEQEKVKSYAEERTLIEIETLQLTNNSIYEKVDSCGSSLMTI